MEFLSCWRAKKVVIEGVDYGDSCLLMGQKVLQIFFINAAKDLKGRMKKFLFYTAPPKKRTDFGHQLLGCGGIQEHVVDASMNSRKHYGLVTDCMQKQKHVVSH
ncbi:unnamed protein product [Cuscuta campestris]|uniref:Uncharacterized protein n=1 Tax=Cuscuta campestris TaxID=132261 RepID=A0A484MAJ3_9ASTE|nr:unnamed protein product [Cuscuta campestris]